MISPQRDRDEVARAGDLTGLAHRRRIICALGLGAVLSLSILGASGGAGATGHAWEDALRQSVRDSDYVLEYTAERGGWAAVPVAVRLYPRAQTGRTMSFDRAGEIGAAPGIRDPAERTQAIGVLRRAREADSVPLLADTLLTDEDVTARVMAARSLGRTRSEAANEPLAAAAIGDDDADVREAAARALGKSWSERAVEPLARVLLEDPRAFVRAAAADALGHTGSELAVDALQAALQGDRQRQVRQSAAEALGDVGGAAARAALEAALEDRHPWVRDAARQALRESADEAFR